MLYSWLGLGFESDESHINTTGPEVVNYYASLTQLIQHNPKT